MPLAIHRAQHWRYLAFVLRFPGDTSSFSTPLSTFGCVRQCLQYYYLPNGSLICTTTFVSWPLPNFLLRHVLHNSLCLLSGRFASPALVAIEKKLIAGIAFEVLLYIIHLGCTLRNPLYAIVSVWRFLLLSFLQGFQNLGIYSKLPALPTPTSFYIQSSIAKVSNPTIAAFNTCQARGQVYPNLNHLQDASHLHVEY